MHPVSSNTPIRLTGIHLCSVPYYGTYATESWAAEFLRRKRCDESQRPIPVWVLCRLPCLQCTFRKDLSTVLVLDSDFEIYWPAATR
jgi:hypothetical protein